MYEFSKDDLQYPVLSIVEMCLPSARMESVVTAEGKKDMQIHKIPDLFINFVECW